MKIAVIGAKGISAKFGGIERYCQELYPQIAERGNQVDLYVGSNHYHSVWFSIFTYQRMNVITLPSIPAKGLSLINVALATVCASFGKYDVIHFHGIAAAWFAWFAQLFSGSSIVVTCHQLESPQVLSNRVSRRLLPWLEKMAIECVDETIVTSQELANYFWRKYRICTQYIANAPTKERADSDRSQIQSLHSFNYRQAFGLDRSRYVLYLGTFEPDRRLDLLIKVFKKLQIPNWKLVLAGEIGDSFEYTTELLDLARQQKNIIFTGEISDNFVADLIRGADVFVDPSTGNNLNSSIAILEAMRSAIPIVASDTATHRQLIGRDRGLLFKSGQFDSLLMQLEYAMSRPNLLLVMAKKAQTYIAVNHNWDKVIYKNLFIYLQLTTETRTPPSRQTFNR